MLSKETRQAALLLFLVAVSLYLNFSLIEVVKQVKHARSLKQHAKVEKIHSEDSYSYLGADHPERVPGVERQRVKMVVEESVRYSIMDPESTMEWLWTGPVGDHAIRLGSIQRGYTISMFHQLHCLRIIQHSLQRGRWSMLGEAPREHLHHCFIYLRQWALCSADTTLEPGDFTRRNFTLERTGGTHTCYDWEPVYDRVNEAWETWEDYRIAHGVPEQTLG